MSGDMPEVLVNFMAEARACGAIREVRGTAYPVSLGELHSWEKAQRARQCARRMKRRGVRLDDRKVFR